MGDEVIGVTGWQGDRENACRSDHPDTASTLITLITTSEASNHPNTHHPTFMV